MTVGKSFNTKQRSSPMTIDRPSDHGRSIIIEPFEGFRGRCMRGLIAHQSEPSAPRHLVDAALGIAAIADYVAKDSVHQQAGNRAVPSRACQLA